MGTTTSHPTKSAHPSQKDSLLFFAPEIFSHQAIAQ